MAKSTSLTEAILDAKELKKMMKMNVEKSLLENLQPRISQIVSKNLQEMSDEYDEETDIDETIDVDALMQEVEDENSDPSDLDNTEDGVDGLDDMSGDGTSEENVSNMTSDDLKQLIKDALQDILGDDDAGEVDATDMDTDAPVDDETEVDENDMYEGLDDIVNEIMADMGEKDKTDKDSSLQEQIKSLTKTNSELKKANLVYKNALNESKLSLVQLSYINGLIVESKLSNEQIIKFTEIIEKTRTPQEAKNIYEAINESIKINSKKSTIKTQTFKESYGVDSNKILPNTKTNPQEDAFVTRMKRNAGLS